MNMNKLFRRTFIHAIGALLAGIGLVSTGCNKSTPPSAQSSSQAPATPQLSDIKVVTNPGGPIVLTTSTAEFQILPSGYVQASLTSNGQRLSLDDPKAGAPNDSGYLVHEGKTIYFTLDFQQAKISEASGKLGRGKRIEIPARGLGSAGTDILRTLSIEAYDDSPNLLLSSVEYKNTGTSDFQIDRVVEQQHRFNAKLADAKVQPYDMWAYQGSSYNWGEDDVLKLKRTSAQSNVMGETVKGGYGGGIPVVAFWTASVGEAVGHV